MALTYNDFLKEAEKSGFLGQFSIYDLNTAQKDPGFGFSMLSYKQDYANAADQAGKDAANQGANALRKRAGSYLGGSDGSKYYGLGPSPGSYQSPYQSAISEALGKMQNYGSFSYDAEKPTYTNQYQNQINDLLGQVQNYGDFSWSKEEDPAYAAYAKQYRREGDRATQQALAQAAAMTGGQVSSAAMTAASQAGDYYAGQLADVIPELYNAAYNRYVSDYGILTDQLGQTQQAEQMDYSKYLNELSQYNTDRAQAYDEYLQGYNMLGSSLSALQSQDQTEYGRLLDQVDFNSSQDALAREETIRQETLAAERTAQQQALAQAQVDAMLQAGAMPSESLLGQSGYASEYAQAMDNWYKQQAAAAAQGSGGGSSSGGGDTTRKSSGYSDVSKRAAKYKTADEALAYLNSMAASGVVTQEEASYIYQVELGYAGVGDQNAAVTNDIWTSPGTNMQYVVVKDGGALPWEVLAQRVEEGKVKEIYDPISNSYTYVKAD